MLWTISVVLIILWILGLGTGFTMGSFIHNSLRSRGCPAGGQSQSGGYDQPKTETCISKSRPKTKGQMEVRAVNGPKWEWVEWQ